MFQRQQRNVLEIVSQELSRGNGATATIEEVTSPLLSPAPAMSEPVAKSVQATTATADIPAASTSGAGAGKAAESAPVREVDDVEAATRRVMAPAPEMGDNGFAEDVVANPSSADSFEFFYRYAGPTSVHLYIQ